ncbi:MAG: sterol desaturase family protein [Bdellovibrionota bacterium]|nr:sterol desaturase family protein [Bdellovibrionota bacterium]
MNVESFLAIKSTLFFSIAGIFLFIELIIQKSRQHLFKNSYSSITAILLGGLNVALVALVFHNYIESNLLLKEDKMLISVFIETICILFLVDLWTYLWHRLNHRLPILWRFHEVHHLDESLHSLSAIRFHAGEIALSYLMRIFIFWFLPVSLFSYLFFEITYMFFNFFAHSRIQMPFQLEKKINKVFVTPRHHRLHHHPLRSIHDNNYGNIFSFWDSIFSSRVDIKTEDSFAFGVSYKKRKGFIKNLISPFQKQST